jgi:integrase
LATKNPTPAPSRGDKASPRLTATRVDSVSPGDYTDPATTGLQLRVRKTRESTSRTWLMRYRWRGQWVRLVIGHRPTMSLADARVRALELRRAIDDGIDPRRARPRRQAPETPQPLSAAATSPDAAHSIETLAREFLDLHVRPNRRRPEYADSILKRDVLPEWKGRDARTIKPREVVELLDGIVKRGSAVMANRVAGLLSQMFRFGVHRAIVDESPVQLLYRPGGKEKPRERSLTDQELEAFLKDPRKPCRFERLERVILILLLTGQRRGELALARWSHIDLKAGTWRIPDEHAKAGRGHVVPLTKWAVREFEALQRLAKHSPYAMPSEPGGDAAIDPKQLTRSLAKCRERFKAEGIAEFTLHDLRRTCRTGLARLEVPPHIAERVLNHAQERIAGTYDTHDYLPEKRAALEKWEKHLEGLKS